jgi:hypothetical protein
VAEDGSGVYFSRVIEDDGGDLVHTVAEQERSSLSS